MMSELRILSLGWGVQSWTLAAMAALGEIEKPDYILHADTTWEHRHTYEFAEKWTAWLEDHGMKVITACDEVAAKKFTDPGTNQTHLPLFTSKLNTTETSNGQLRRSCTHRWKITPQRRVISEILKERGIKKTPGVVDQMIGISLDEWTRMKDSDVKYINLTFPLVDRKMKRKDCGQWLHDNDLPVPEKSACTFCPYHSLYAWHLLHEAGGPDWKQCLEVDEMIRHKRPGYLCYLSYKRVPLKELYFGEFTEPTLFDLSAYPCDSGHCFL